MLTIYTFIFIIVYFCIKMIIIGIKCELQEQLQYKSIKARVNNIRRILLTLDKSVSKLLSVHKFVAILLIT